ncbi:hypothetical protein PENFLA_c071G03084 [Penicillium flavigenum]|uniref:NACHT domain-containing protein n=1 Tax=Penicillium flavigenum TaxID=254877 RepID=A0A1V6SCX1_9EURO|nr:hypothetical protein PENFLA_c071G03084 [Penicillium flavigenum]
MDALSPTASVIAVIQLAGSIVKICGDYIQDVKGARDEIFKLQLEVTHLTGVLQELKLLLQSPNGSRLSTSQALHDPITMCFSILAALEVTLGPGKRTRAMRRLGLRALAWPLKRTEVEQIVSDLERYKSILTLSLQIDQTTIITGISKTTDRIDCNMDLKQLPVARGAEFDSYTNQYEDYCHPGTRTDILRQIMGWARSPRGKCIFWLNGRAGTGKSTISRTMAKTFEDFNLLGASFFFKRGEGDRGNAIKLFPTITRQLARIIPQLIPGVQKAIHDNSDIATKGLMEQFDKLLFQPLLKLNPSALSIPIVVIVIDALDECDVDNDIRLVLQLLPLLQKVNTVRLRFLLTSRPELPIRLGFSNMADHNHEDFHLHEISKAKVEEDISLFLSHRLSKIRMDRSLPSGWPGVMNIQILVALSVPLFIFASTICRILEDPHWDPEDSLHEILTHRNNGSKLDGTYLPVLNRLLNKQSEKQKKQLVEGFQQVVGAIVILESPLSVSSLSRLLDLPKRLLHLRLNQLHSVLSVPDDEALPGSNNNAMSEFLYDAKRFVLKNRQIADDVPLQLYCSGLVFAPRKSIIRRNFKSELPNWIRKLPKVEETWAADFQALEGHSDWVSSVAFSPQGGLLASGSYDKTIRIWDTATGALRLILNGHLGLVESVAFSPDGQRLVSGSEDKTIRLWDIATGTLQQTLKGHSGWVSSVTFSPQGGLLASGSYDKTIRIWNSITGAAHHTLEGHSDWVKSVAFSPDGRRLASGSEDKTIRLWDTATGVIQQTLHGHSGWIESVVFSPDGQSVVSSSEDESIRIWDAATGALRQTLEGHSGRVSSVAFSPDGKRLVSGSEDDTVRLWDFPTGTLQQTLEGHSGWVKSVAFSPNAGLLASGSWDMTVRLWYASTMVPRQGFERHSGRVDSVAFSPDDRLLASGSEDGIVRLWDAATCRLQRILEGHSDRVSSVVFSPDGRLLASGSDDGTICLWDATTCSLRRIFEGHPGHISSVGFSSDSRLLASGPKDDTAQLWDASTGALERVFEGHSGWVQSVTFSPESRQLASSSFDKTIRLWDTTTGALKQTVIVEGVVSTLEFSPTGSHLSTNLGIFNIEASRGKQISDWPRGNDEVLIQDRQWIMLHGEKAMWLPPEYRPRCSAVRGSTLALGHASGRISLLSFI